MKVTELTKIRLREARLERAGYERVDGKGLGWLWQLDRGARRGWTITEAIVGPDQKSIYWKGKAP